MRRKYGLAALVAVASVMMWAPAFSREVGFEERVAAERAIEETTYRHQAGTTLPFDRAVAQDLIVAKVRSYLARSAALAGRSPQAVDDAALAREWDRIRTRTRMPERLEELVTALGNDPDRIRECLVRPALVNRLAAPSPAGPETARAMGIVDAELARIGATRASDAPVSSRRKPDAAGAATPSFAAPSALTSPSSCLTLDTWRCGILDDAPVQLRDHVAVWTGALMLVWGTDDGGGSAIPAAGGRYDPTTDTWTRISPVNAPQILEPMGVWSGSRLLVWGRTPSPVVSTTGASYDPVADLWTPMSQTGAPTRRHNASIVWTGAQMIVWGGQSDTAAFLDNGGRYDPTSDTWTSMSTSGAPSGRASHIAVWSGNRMIVWGGFVTAGPSIFFLNTGGRYDPVADAWTTTTTTGAPQSRAGHVSVWTGSRLLIWGGSGTDVGGRYDPVADAWSPMSVNNQPATREGARAVWTGTRMLVWGHDNARTGGVYDPQANTWTAMDAAAAPTPRGRFTLVWTGQEAIVWGGTTMTSAGALNTGSRYDPASNVWTTTDTVGPTPRRYPLVVWTGNQVIVYGGWTFDNVLSGARYDPVLDAWAPMAAGVPGASSSNYQAVWTGQSMLVWGGAGTGGRYDPIADAWYTISSFGASGSSGTTLLWTGQSVIFWGGQDAVTHTFMATGKRYDPVADSWSAMSTAGAPSPRSGMSAVWTGSRVIVWGGADNFAMPHALRSGGLYDPATDTWTPTNQNGAPDPRYGHAAAWTGSEMIVVGGVVPNGPNPDVGGRYDPASDTWLPMAARSVPTDASSVWTGTRLIFFGGASTPGPGTGTIYDPATDTWSPTSTAGAPAARFLHGAVWTGAEMFVWGGDGASTGYLADGGLYSAADADRDAVSDGCDNCPALSNPDQSDADGDGLGDACDADDDNDLLADGADNCPFIFNRAQRDTDADGRGDFCDDCPGSADPAQADADGDGAGDVCDCAPNDPLTRRPPDIGDLTVIGTSGGGISLAWSSVVAATSYAVTRGSLGSLSGVEYGTCLASGLSATSVMDATVPPAGHGYAYLVQAVNGSCGGAGPLGYTSTETERINGDPGACTP